VKDLDKLPIKDKIEGVGQPYVDDPIYRTINLKPEITTPIATGIAQAFGSAGPKPVQILTGYNHVRLRWMKPGKDGKLVPR